jgi:xylulokinase
MRVIDTFARLLQVDLATFDELALAGEPGAGGLVLLPYLDGERTPNLPGASGTIAGLRPDVTPEQLARAAVEGVVCGLLDALEALRVGGVTVRPADGTLLLGGGARLRSVQRVLADLTRCSIVVPHGEPVATGACVQAAAVLHQAAPSDVAAAWKLGSGRAIEPDLSVDTRLVRGAYAALRDRYYATS